MTSDSLARQLASRARGAGRNDLAVLFALAERPDVISFAGGFPDPAWFRPEFREVADQILTDNPGAALQYGPTPGLTAFRELVAQRSETQGVPAGVDNILITSGSLQGLDLVCKVFLDPGDVVVVEDPTYLGAIQTIAGYDGVMVGVTGDDKGLRVDALDEAVTTLVRQGRRPKFIYTVPSFQNPTGLTLTLERRHALLDVAARRDLPVVEDHAYAELHYEGRPLPSLAALAAGAGAAGAADSADADGPLVIHLGTFSKIFSPGLRLGWVVAPPAVIGQLIRFKQGADQCSNTLGQLMALEFGRRGLIDAQIATTRASLRAKRDLTLAALHRHFGDLGAAGQPGAVQYTVPDGGFYTWVSLPREGMGVGAGMDTAAMLALAITEHQVAYVAGPAFYAGSGGRHQLRVCFSLVSPTLIDEGIARLRRAVEAWTNR